MNNKDTKLNEKRLYLTKNEGNGFFSYIGDPLNPNTTLDTGIIKVDLKEVRTDEYGAYITRFYEPTKWRDERAKER